MRKFPHSLKEIISIIESRYYVYYREDKVLAVYPELYDTELNIIYRSWFGLNYIYDK
jgi:hypothetical protein